MRLCFVVPEYANRPPIGGIATYTREAARWLVQHGHSVHVVHVTRRGPHDNEDDDGVHVHHVAPIRIRPRSVLRWASRIPGMKNLYEAYAGWNLLEDSLGAWWSVCILDRSAHFDLIECVDFAGLGFWGLLSPLRNRVILRGHGYLQLELDYVSWAGRHFHHNLESFCVGRAPFILTVSKYLANSYEEFFGVDGKRLIVVPTGINAISLLPQAVASPLNYQWGDAFTVLFVGRIEPTKGSDMLFSALQRVHAEIPDIRAILVGSVPDAHRHLYEQFMRTATEWCWHPGTMDLKDVLALMHRASLIVLPSRTETLSRVLIEAQFCGLPQVAANVGGVSEVVADGVTGLLVEPENSLALAEAILLLYASPEMMVKMGQQSRERAWSNFEISTVMGKQVETYHMIMERRLLPEVLKQR